MSKILVAGPWIGEFGWELFGWQGYIRAISKNYVRTICISRPGHGVLYTDFAEFVAFDPEVDSSTMWMAQDKPRVESKIYYPSYMTDLKNNPDVEWLEPGEVYQKQWLTLRPGAPPHKFIKFGTEKREVGFDVLIHARATEKLGTAIKNWPVDNYKSLVDRFPHLKFASIGTLKGAHHIPGTIDRRGLPLVMLVDTIASSQIMIGPTAGPLHLSALCETESIVWTGYKRSVLRHETLWNPFNVNVIVMSPGGDPWDNGIAWQPTTTDVQKCLEVMLN